MVAEAVAFYGERAPEAPRVQAVRTDHDVLRESYRCGESHGVRWQLTTLVVIT